MTGHLRQTGNPGAHGVLAQTAFNAAAFAGVDMPQQLQCHPARPGCFIIPLKANILSHMTGFLQILTGTEWQMGIEGCPSRMHTVPSPGAGEASFAAGELHVDLQKHPS